MKTKIDHAEALRSWDSLNTALMKATEDQCLPLIETEKAGLNRPTFVKRIYSRYNKLRTLRERGEVTGS